MRLFLVEKKIKMEAAATIAEPSNVQQNNGNITMTITATTPFIEVSLDTIFEERNPGREEIFLVVIVKRLGL